MSDSRGVRLDFDETPEQQKTDKFWMILDRVIQYLIGYADRLAEVPIGRVSCGIEYSASVSTPRWHRAIIP
jgi:hypothetical protein